jgi:hypothetical protein
MNWLRKLWEGLRQWFGGQQGKIKAAKVAELPEELERTLIYLVGENEHLWFAVMLCPCGCGEHLYLNLDPSERPCWEFMRHKWGIISLHPSIHRMVGCRSHFWLRNGQIIWAHD